jgi:hypothetical protein
MVIYVPKAFQQAVADPRWPFPSATLPIARTSHLQNRLTPISSSPLLIPSLTRIT